MDNMLNNNVFFLVIIFNTVFFMTDAYEKGLHKIGIKSQLAHVTSSSFEYPYNPNVSIEEWEKLKPYFLPHDHPVKLLLDVIFHRQRVVSSRESLIESGFELNSPKHYQNLIVCCHSSLKGYLIKTYVDTQDMCDWENFYRRITGARSIRASIKKHRYQKLFKVPKKWLYPLSLQHLPLSASGCYPKHFVLVVENMHILSHHENADHFKHKITPQILDALYVVISEEGLLDSVCRGNIPFNKAGKLNFIDTEHHHHPPSSIPYKNLIPYLSKEMGEYWQKITQCQP